MHAHPVQIFCGDRRKNYAIITLQKDHRGNKRMVRLSVSPCRIGVEGYLHWGPPGSLSPHFQSNPLGMHISKAKTMQDSNHGFLVLTQNRENALKQPPPATTGFPRSSTASKAALTSDSASARTGGSLKYLKGTRLVEADPQRGPGSLNMCIGDPQMCCIIETVLRSLLRVSEYIKSSFLPLIYSNSFHLNGWTFFCFF